MSPPPRLLPPNRTLQPALAAARAGEARQGGLVGVICDRAVEDAPRADRVGAGPY